MSPNESRDQNSAPGEIHLNPVSLAATKARFTVQQTDWDGVSLIRRRFEPEDGITVSGGVTEHMLATRHVSGLVRTEIDGKWFERSQKANRITFFPAGTPHRSEWRTTEDVTGPNITHVAIPTATFDSIIEQSELPIGELLPAMDQQNSAITTCMSMLCKAANNATRASRLYVDTVVQSLVIQVALHTNSRGAVASRNASAGDISRIRRAMDYLHDNYADNPTLKQLADVESISTYHLVRVFKNATGKTPHQYQMHVRVNRAIELLHSLGKTKLSLKSIAVHCGFADQAHMTRVFRRITGTTPGQCKETHEM